jgi:hypothetical protein
MGKKEDLRSARRFAKPVAFFALVFLLVFISKFQVQYSPPLTVSALPDEAREKVIVTSMNGAAQMVSDLVSQEAELPPTPVDFSTSSLSSNEIMMQPKTSHAAGCTSDFYNTIEVNITTWNELMKDTKGALNLTVYDGNTGQLLESKLFVLDLKPRTAFSVNAIFHVTTLEADPVFDIKVTFPTAQELGQAKIVTRMTLLEYFLTLAGLHASA